MKFFLKFFFLFITNLCIGQSPGSLDLTFDSDGIVVTNLSTPADAGYSRSIMQPDGKFIVTTTFRTQGNSQVLLARYLNDGSLDSSWGQNGITLKTIGNSKNFTQPREIYLQPDGKVLVAGVRDSNSLLSPFIMRLNIDGSLDSTFGNNGMHLPYFGKNTLYRQVVAQGNKIHVFGNDLDSTMITTFNTFDGSLDLNFGNQGILKFDLPPFSPSVQRIATLQNQKILLFEPKGYLHCFLPNGNIDSSFGSNNTGYIETIIPKAGIGTGAVPCMFIQSDQKILLGGTTEQGDPNVDKSMIERYYSNGQIDTSFGDSGVLVVDFGYSSGTFNDGGTEITAINIDSNDNIIASGHVRNGGGSMYSALVRYDSIGNVDSTFGNNGVVVIDIHPNDSIEFTYNVHIQPDNKIVQTGYTRMYSQVTSGLPPNSINLVRYHGDSVITSTTQAPPTPQSHLDFFPNPAKDQLNTHFTLAESGQMELSLYDVQGRKVQTLLQGERPAGEYQETFQLESGLPAGLYVLKLETEHSYFAKILVIQ